MKNLSKKWKKVHKIDQNLQKSWKLGEIWPKIKTIIKNWPKTWEKFIKLIKNHRKCNKLRKNWRKNEKST